MHLRGIRRTDSIETLRLRDRYPAWHHKVELWKLARRSYYMVRLAHIMCSVLALGLTRL